MIAIIDYDAGNLMSVLKALEYLGQDAIVARDRETIMRADKVILPGVGSFGDAKRNLDNFGLTQVVKDYAASGKPFLGICLGMQMLFEDSEETPGVEGLSLLKGHILKIPKKDDLKIPHMGWNSIDIKEGARLFEGLDNNPFVYFVHSYYLKAENEADVAASCQYSTHIHASVEKGNIFGCQFHPEKSSEVGLKILSNFAKIEM